MAGGWETKMNDTNWAVETHGHEAASLVFRLGSANSQNAAEQGKQLGTVEKAPVNHRKRSRTEKTEAVRKAIRTQWRTHSDREIADNLEVSPTTIGNHRKHLEKLGEILPQIKSGQPIEACLRVVSIFAV